MTSAAARFTTAAEFTTTFSGEIHPLAAEFPMIGADELADLARSMWLLNRRCPS